MSYNYTVPKKKKNRITYRVTGIIFIALCALQCVTFFSGYAKHKFITAFFIMILASYGIYLIRMSFRRQSFDITYRFDEEGITVTHHYGIKKYSYDEVDFITMVIPDSSMIFYVLNLKAGKDIYTIPFTNKQKFCEDVYEFVNSRIKHDEDEV